MTDPTPRATPMCPVCRMPSSSCGCPVLAGTPAEQAKTVRRAQTAITATVPSVTCTRRLTFCAGHRVMGHEGKCAHLHGHNYVAHIEATNKHMLDAVGRVVDFSVLKEKVGGWLESEWDHGFVLNVADSAAIAGLVEFSAICNERPEYALPVTPSVMRPVLLPDQAAGQWGQWRCGRVAGMSQKLYLLPYNPTAENMARFLVENVCPAVLAGTGVHVMSVTIEETENCSANHSIA